jgi:hypothetical protein
MRRSYRTGELADTVEDKSICLFSKASIGHAWQMKEAMHACGLEKGKRRLALRIYRRRMQFSESLTTPSLPHTHTPDAYREHV